MNEPNPYDLRFESLITKFLDNSFATSEELFTEEEIELLRNKALHYDQSEAFRLAGVGDRFNFQKDRSIRSDKIHWIKNDTEDNIELIFLDRIKAFIDYLNLTCYTGIKDYEFHFAIYESGSFYERHSDQFKGRDIRQFSVVLYLTENWREGDGGELVIYQDQTAESGEKLTQTIHKIQPIGGRLVFFDSSLEHEVLLSKNKRISLTGWMKRNII